MDEEAKALLKEFEKEVEIKDKKPEEEEDPEEEDEDVVVDPPVVQVPKTDWKKKHEDLVAKYKELLEKKREYQKIIERQMEMIRYMGEVGLRTGLKYDELDMISRTM